MSKKIILLGFVVNNHKKELLLNLDLLPEYEVYYLCLKHLDYIDLINQGISSEKVFSYPLSLKKYSEENQTSEEIKNQIDSNEKKYNLRCSSKLISYNYDRSMLPSFKEEDLYKVILFEQNLLINLITNLKVNAVLGELSRSYYVIAYDICNKLNIKYISPIEFRSSYFGEPLYALYDDTGDKIGFKELYNDYISGENRSSKLGIEFAKEFESRIFNQDKFKSKKLRTFESGWGLFYKKFRKRVKNLRPLYESYKIDKYYNPEKLKFKSQIWSIIDRFIYHPIRSKLHYYYKSTYFKNTIDTRKLKYIYFPLHFYPELVSSVWGNDFINYYDQELHLIQQISKNLPTGYKLIVKEHMPMVTNRKTTFYRRVNSLYNTILMSPSFNNFKLIEDSKCVITICSTTGLEAFLKNKPVLTYQGTYYKHINNIKKIDLNRDLSVQLKEACEDKFEVKNDDKIAALSAFYDSSCTFEYESSSANEFDITYTKASIKNVSAYLKKYILNDKSDHK